jgi:hypothetical protein
MDTNQTERDTADPLPYVITFGILVVIMLGVLTWVLGVWFQDHQCYLFPNYWCSDTWTCNTSCATGSGFSPCFTNPGPTGMSSCLFGPTSAIANVCTPPVPGGTGILACNCPTGMATQTGNCFAGCPQSVGTVTSGAACCCMPNTPGCPWTTLNPPPPQCTQPVS